MIAMIRDAVESALAVWRESLAGSAIIVVVAGLGWILAADRARLPVRIVGWWIDHVVQPLVRLRSWTARAVVIAINNSVACGLMMLLGAVPLVGWAGVGCIGLTLGIAIRLMTTIQISPAANHAPATPNTHASDDGKSASRIWTRVAITVGLALNVLELPAIMLSAGLALGQGAMSEAVSLAAAVRTFSVLVVPTLVVAAGGEALLMGATHALRPGRFDATS
jgi:hypothetical protein